MSAQVGAPLIDSTALEVTLSDKVQELRTLSERLEFLPAHDALYLLQHVVTTPRLMYLLRTAPRMDRKELLDYDLQLRSSLSKALNIDLSDTRWNQALLPVRGGGLGVRGAAMLAPSAYLASAAGTTQLVSHLTQQCSFTVEDPYVSKALASWTSGVNQTSSPPVDAFATRRRSWDDPRCKFTSDLVSQQMTSPADKARLLAVTAPGSSAWLEAMPLAQWD